MEPCFHQFLFDLLSTTLTLKDFYQPLSCLLAAQSALLFFSQFCGFFLVCLLGLVLCVLVVFFVSWRSAFFFPKTQYWVQFVQPWNWKARGNTSQGYRG